jgi:hypothetical protein
VDKADKAAISRAKTAGDLAKAELRGRQALEKVQFAEQEKRTTLSLRAGLEEQRAGARTTEKLRLAEESPAARARGKQAARLVEQQPQLAAFERSRAALEQEIVGRHGAFAGRPLILEEGKPVVLRRISNLVEQAKGLAPGTPGLDPIVIEQSLEGKLAARLREADAQTLSNLQAKRITDPLARQMVLDETAKAGVVGSPAQHPQLFERARRTQTVQRALGKQLEEVGLQQVGEGGLGLAKPGLLAGSTVPEAETKLFDEISRLAKTGGKAEVAQAKGLIPQIGKAAGRVPVKRLGLAGLGLGGLALLLGQGGNKPQQQNPMMQLQLMKMMEEMQNKRALTQSLVQSRQASGEQSMARALLLRLQAAQASGGPVI